MAALEGQYKDRMEKDLSKKIKDANAEKAKYDKLNGVVEDLNS